MSTGRAASAAGWTAVSVASTSASQLAVNVVLMRVLAPEQAGLAAIVALAAVFLDVVAGLGLTSALIQRRRVTSRELSSVHGTNIALAGGVFAVVATFASPIAALLGAPAAAPLLMVCAGAAVVGATGQAYRAMLEKRLDFRPLGLADAAFSLVFLVVAIGLALLGGDALSAALGLLAGTVARTAVIVVAGRRVVRMRWHWRLADTRRFFAYGVWQSADGLLNFLGNSLATLATGRFVNAAALAGFSAASTIGISIPARLSPILTRVLFPYFAILQDDRDRLRGAYLRMMTLVGVLNIPVLLCVALAGDDLMLLVFGANWSSFGPVLAILAVAGAVRSLGYPVGSLLAGADALRLGVVLNVARIAANVPLILGMTALWGVEGAAWSMVVMGAVSYALGYVCLRYVVPTPIGAYLAATRAPVVLSILPVAAVAATQGALAGAELLPRVLATVAAGAAGLAVALLCSRDATVRAVVAEAEARLVRPRVWDVAVVLPADERFDGTGGAVASWVRNAYAELHAADPSLRTGVFCPRGGEAFAAPVHRVALPVFDALDAVVRSLARVAGRLLGRNPDGIVRVLTLSGRIWIRWVGPRVSRARVVHLHNNPAYAVALRRSGYRGRIVQHMHNDPVDGVRSAASGRGASPTEAEVIAAVDTWVFCSAHLAGVAERALGLSGAVVVPNGATVPEAAPIAHERGDTVRVAFAGRLIPEKGAAEALAAVAELAARRPVRFDVYGGKAPGASIGESPYTRALRDDAARVEERHPGSAARVRGFVSPVVLSAELARCDVFLYPCRWDEPFGMVLLDAMSVGTPVVTVARGGIPEIVRDDAGGVLLPPGATAADLAAAVERVVDDPNYARRRLAARRVAVEDFGWDAIAAALRTVLTGRA